MKAIAKLKARLPAPYENPYKGGGGGGGKLPFNSMLVFISKPI